MGTVVVKITGVILESDTCGCSSSVPTAALVIGGSLLRKVPRRQTETKRTSYIKWFL